MSKFEYKAINSNGKEISGFVDAVNTQEAIGRIKDKGYYPIQLTETEDKFVSEPVSTSGGHVKAPVKKGGVSKEIVIPFLGIGVVKSQDVALFTRQLATLIDAGLPLVRSLNVLHDQLKLGPLKDVIESLSKEVSAGGTLSEALAKYPKIFNSLYINMIKAGEAGGVLEIVLERLAEFNEKSLALIGKVKAAMAYPVLVVVFSSAVLLFLTLFLIPKFMDIFASMDIEEMPVPTMLIMNFSRMFKNPLCLGLGLGLVAALIILYKTFSKMKGFKLFIAKIKLRVPVAGELTRKIEVAMFSRTLGTLISSGVPILQALRITRGTMSNELISQALGRVHDSIREGESIAAPLKASGAFPLMVVNMIDVGEETGSLDNMLIKVADIYDGEVDTTISALTSIIEPFLIISMGLIVGFIVIAMFLPLIQLMSSIGVN
ncbi:MAG: type II secretion system F family protein [Candidatus Omnitrophica bacterium]|nr:type II secretion system F family protein [Candidatus Omnitrophota bacterium]